MSANKDREERTRIDAEASRQSSDGDSDDKMTQMRGSKPVVASVTIIGGPGRGTSLPVYRGDNAIGRGKQNLIDLSFGDETIHRTGHAWIKVDEGSFVVEHGRQANPVHVNGRLIEDAQPIVMGDRIKVGSTTLQLGPK